MPGSYVDIDCSAKFNIANGASACTLMSRRHIRD